MNPLIPPQEAEKAAKETAKMIVKYLPLVHEESLAIERALIDVEVYLSYRFNVAYFELIKTLLNNRLCKISSKPTIQN